ncbi:MAG: DNA replication and repair protein RecF [Gemmatimonadetes bacterium]|nr:DNA replication and repair protein RecF [Gemmatimonadota bacterium]
MTSAAVVCTELLLRNFRNFEELRLELPPAGAAIIGDNGSGKTNLVEAVYYLEIFRSFRGAPDEQLVRFGEDVFFIRGRFRDATGRETEVAAAYEPRTRTKRVTLDGNEPARLSDALGLLGAVVFSPSDVQIVAGGPGERRRFLDIVLSLNVPGYVTALQRYRHVLRQRNAMLRAEVSGAVLEAFDEGLVQAGARLVVDRARWVAEHASRFSELFREIGDDGSATLRYHSDAAHAGAATEAEAATALRERLARVAPRERERGVTLAGPHRDDLGLIMAAGEHGVDLRQYGSGGQQRTGAIALRLVEADTILAARGRRPLVLLDDVFAELDPGRSRRIIRLFREGGHGQVALTAPKDTDVELGPRAGAPWSGPAAAGLPRPETGVAEVARWRIAHGRIGA